MVQPPLGATMGRGLGCVLLLRDLHLVLRILTGVGLRVLEATVENLGFWGFMF